MNLRVVEKEDLPLLTDWYNDLEFFGEFVWLLQKSRMEREKWYDNLPVDAKLFFIEKKDGKKIGTISHFLEGTLLEIGYFLFPRLFENLHFLHQYGLEHVLCPLKETSSQPSSSQLLCSSLCFFQMAIMRNQFPES